MFKLLKSQKGFTLIELLVVIAILGILAAGAITGIVGFMNKGKLESLNTEAASVQTAVMAYMVDNDDVEAEDITMQNLIDAGFIFKSPQANYTVDANGIITGEDDPYELFIWDSTNHEWKK